VGEFSSVRTEFTGGNGYRLAGIFDIPAAPPQATGLFTHCFTCNKDLKAIVRISRGLAAEGFLTLRYDLTGLGGSQGDFSETNFSTNQSDLLAATEHLSHEHQAPSYLIGHSFGGACSLSMAGQIASVKAVVALAAPSDTHHLADLLDRMDPAIRSTGAGSVTIGGRTYAIHQQMLDDFRSHDITERITRLEKPVLLLHSPVDETLGFEHATRLYSLLSAGKNAPSVSLVSLPGADHLLVRNPADISFVTEVLAAWLRRNAVD